eukprot:3410673-Ditylum_brightwellii.AAC.1
MPDSFRSLRKNAYVFIYLVLPQAFQLLTKSTAPLVFICNTVGSSTCRPMHSNNHLMYNKTINSSSSSSSSNNNTINSITTTITI